MLYLSNGSKPMAPIGFPNVLPLSNIFLIAHTRRFSVEQIIYYNSDKLKSLNLLEFLSAKRFKCTPSNFMYVVESKKILYYLNTVDFVHISTIFFQVILLQHLVEINLF